MPAVRVLWMLVSGVRGMVLLVTLVALSRWKPAVELGTISSNKLDARRCYAVELLPAGRGGEGRRRSGEASASSRWRDWNLLQRRANHAAAMFASAICGRKGGPLRRLVGALSKPPVRRPIPELLVGSTAFSLSCGSSPTVLRWPTMEAPRRWRGPRSRSRFLLYSRGPLCKSSSLCCIFFIFQGLDCKMYPPLLI